MVSNAAARARLSMISAFGSWETSLGVSGELAEVWREVRSFGLLMSDCFLCWARAATFGRGPPFGVVAGFWLLWACFVATLRLLI